MGIMNKPPSKEYQDNWDKIFNKKNEMGPETTRSIKELNEAHSIIDNKYRKKQKARMLNEVERADLREDLKNTINIVKQIKK